MLDHPLERVVGGHDHVITGIAGLELGKQLVIVGEEIHLHRDAGRRFEISERRLADIGIPVVEIELRLLGRPRGGLLADEADADHGSAETFQN